MVSKYESQVPVSPTAPVRQGRTTSLAKVGWGILGAAVALWGASSMSIVYGASLRTGWCLLLVFVALSAIGLGLVGTGGRLRKPQSEGETTPIEVPEAMVAERAWVEHWERLMCQPVR